VNGWIRFCALPAAALTLGALALGACADISPYRYTNVYEMTQPAASSEKSFSDGSIKVRFWIDAKKIHFYLTNLTGEPITIDWNSASYIHIDGQKYPVADIRSAFTDRRNNPDPVIVKPGETVREFAAPVKNVEKLEQWTWYVYPLFNLFDEKAYDNKGKIFGLDLPIKTRGGWVRYKFRFQISNVVPRASQV